MARCTLYADRISTPNAGRNMSIDFVNALESGEVVSTQTVVSLDEDLVISNVSNATTVVYFRMTTADVTIDRTVAVDVQVTGSLGNAEHYRIHVPIGPYLCR